jgi:diaminohydroxyphosphoribosylaminopyrimidine deaminase / 5-amino-6-(5-phosphoribosylamino)uracil reductase
MCTFVPMKPDAHHEFFMKRCLELAAAGFGRVAPNPLVGCVIVHDGRIIGEGFHRKYGEAHAEVHAIDSVREKNFLQDSVLYVNLEPCAHRGKTPPCADLIMQWRIPTVVTACHDPNPLVSGQGVQKLQAAGVEVVQGILKKEAEELNRRFFTFHTRKRPYVILKWAQSMDGFIDCCRIPGDGNKPEWITSEKLRMLVHKWRTEENAIMVGSRTALLDNPRLTARDWKGRAPLRIVVDRKNILPPELHVFDGSADTLVLNETLNCHKNNIEYLCMDFTHDIIDPLLSHLHTMHIQSLIVEGGSSLLASFINTGLWDEARVFTGDRKFGQGVSAPDFPFDPQSETLIGMDTLSIFRNN